MTSNVYVVFSCLHKCYEQSEAGVDFVCSNQNMKATKILINAVTPVNFRPQQFTHKFDLLMFHE